MYGYEHVEQGSPIRGNDGVDVYLRENGYYVEHFSLGQSTTFVRHKIGPFPLRQEATEIEKLYRERWGQ